MQFGDYQRQAKTTAVYQEGCSGSLARHCYVAMGLAGEAGEYNNQMKKVIRDDGTEITPERKRIMRDELGDVLWYVAMACEEHGISMDVVAQANLDKLADRAERGAIRGDRRVSRSH